MDLKPINFEEKFGRWAKLIAPGLLDKWALKAIREAKQEQEDLRWNTA
jgi:hypothetical protein